MGTLGRWDDATIGAIASLSKTISCRVRLEILAALSGGQACVRDLADHMELDRTLVSHHLRGLSKAGLVVATRSGHRRVYALHPGVGCFELDGQPVLGLRGEGGWMLVGPGLPGPVCGGASVMLELKPGGLVPGRRHLPRTA